MPEPQRIAKLLARAGIASRRDIERMIEEAEIAIDGKTVDKPATLLASLKGVTVDGQPVSAPEPARLFLYHKPPGLLTAARDPQGRPTIYDRLPKGLPRVMPVGRLDMNTEGLLLLTTDGELKRQLELPASGVERTYRARAFGGVSQEQLEALIEGVEIEGRSLRPDRRQSGAQHRPQPVDRIEADGRQEPRGSPRPRTSRPPGQPPDPHRLRPVRARRPSRRHGRRGPPPRRDHLPQGAGQEISPAEGRRDRRGSAGAHRRAGASGRISRAREADGKASASVSPCPAPHG